MFENYYWEVRTVDGSFRGFVTGRTKHKVERKLMWLFPDEKLIVGRNISKYADKHNRVSKYTWQYIRENGRHPKH
jgi:hypothetical protein